MSWLNLDFTQHAFCVVSATWVCWVSNQLWITHLVISQLTYREALWIVSVEQLWFTWEANRNRVEWLWYSHRTKLFTTIEVTVTVMRSHLTLIDLIWIATSHFIVIIPECHHDLRASIPIAGLEEWTLHGCDTNSITCRTHDIHVWIHQLSHIARN